MAKALNQYTKKMINKQLKNINNAKIGQIIEHDTKKMLATVKLLEKINNIEIKPLVKVPVGFLTFGNYIIRPEYQKNDIVQIIINDYDIENIVIDGQSVEVNSKNKNRLDNSIVLCSIKKINSEDFPAKKGVYIGGKNNETYINIYNNNIELKCNNFEIDCNKMTVNGDNFEVTK